MKKVMRRSTVSKITGSVMATTILSISLVITTFALVWATVSADNHLFQSGNVKINLNDGAPVIREGEVLFEPGMTVKKDFFLQNQSTWDVWYKLYFTDIEGPLADVMEIAIKDEDEKILFEGKIGELTQEKVGAAEEQLKLNERKNLSIWFHFPEEAGNEAQAQYLSFTLSAQAVQTKNNPHRIF